jgi:signal-transduction protein with cAMP-binding, CBS, and nucleotidyltransferase domain
MGAEWCRSESEWKNAYRDWIDSPSGGGADHVFDFRAVRGEAAFVQDVRSLLSDGLDRRPAFLDHLARKAAARPTPLSFFRRKVLARDGSPSDALDLEGQGLEPLAASVRVLALEARVPETNTLSRLKQTAALLSLNKQLEDDVHEAFSFMTVLLVGRYLEVEAAGELLLDPAELNVTQRKILKDCFTVVNRLQEMVLERAVLRRGAS